MEVRGRKRRRRHKRRHLECVRDDINEKKLLSRDEVCDRATWSRRYLIQIEERYVGTRVMGMEVQQGRKRRRGFSRSLLNSVMDHDIREKALSVKEVYDSSTCQRMSTCIDQTYTLD